MSDIMIDLKTAYSAMFYFLQTHYRQTGATQVWDLVGQLDVFETWGVPMDPASWPEWLDAVQKANEEPLSLWGIVEASAPKAQG